MNEKKTGFKIGPFLTKYTMIIALVLVYILFSILTDGRLLLAQNMSNLLVQNGYVLVLACGMLLCILTGGNIDLSVGSVICLTGGIAAVMMKDYNANPYFTILLCVVIGLACGLWHGFWIGHIRIPPFITTLGGMFIFRGLGRLILDSKTVAPTGDVWTKFSEFFNSYITIPGLDGAMTVNSKGKEVWEYLSVDSPFGTIKAWSPLIAGAIIFVILMVLTVRSRSVKAKRGYRQNSALMDYGSKVVIGIVIMWYCLNLSKYKGINVMLLWVFGICLVYNFITSKTTFGRYFYAVGGNEKATKLSGIDTNKVYFIAYASMGLLAGLCGMLCLARVGSVSGATGTSFEMDAIGACFIGGASAYGGSGKISGVIIGALLLGIINMGMSILGLGDSWQYVVKGGVLLVAVIFDVVSSRKGK